MSGSTLKLRGPMGGSTFRPASVISPSLSSRRTRSLFSSVQGLCFLRGVKRCMRTPFTSVDTLSIHPKQRASSTASRYQKCLPSTGRPRFTITQHSGWLAWLAESHWRNWLRLVVPNMLWRSVVGVSCISGVGFMWIIVLCVRCGGSMAGFV